MAETPATITEATMELDLVRQILTRISLDHSVKEPSEELEAIRGLAAAMLHMAEAINDLQRRLPTRSEYF
jgi:hypothetical protein